MIEILIEAERIGLHRFFEKSSLFLYVQELLGFSEAMTYALISVARKSREYPVLRKALEDQKISVSTAHRLNAHLTPETAEEWIEFASTHTRRELEKALQENAEELGLPDEVSLKIPRILVEKFKRVRDIQSSNVDLITAMDLVADEYLRKHDPVKKAGRARAKANESKTEPVKDDGAKKEQTLCARTNGKRKPLTAQQKHEVIDRDGGRCTFIGSDNVRCPNERWLHIHHKKEVWRGGTNEPENLTSLCAFHHDLVHQMTFPLDDPPI